MTRSLPLILTLTWVLLSSPATLAQEAPPALPPLQPSVDLEISESDGEVVYRYVVRSGGAGMDRMWIVALGLETDSVTVRATPRGWTPRAEGADHLWWFVALGPDREVPETWREAGPPVMGWRAREPGRALRPGERAGPFTLASHLLPAPVRLWAVGRPEMTRPRLEDSLPLDSLFHSRAERMTVGPGIPASEAAAPEATLTLLTAIGEEACARGWIERRTLCTSMRSELESIAGYLEDEEYMAVIGSAKALELEMVSRAEILDGYVDPVAMHLMSFYARRLVDQARRAHREMWH